MAVIRHRYTSYGKDYQQIAKYSVGYKDVFSFKDLLILMREWLIENSYAVREEHEFPEAFYMQKIKRAQEKDLKILWRFTKNPYPGTTQTLWRFDLDVDIKAEGLTDVELVLKGQKVRAQKGKVEVEVVANLVMDYEQELKKKPHLKIFKFLTRKRFMELKLFLSKQLYNEAYTLQDEIKNYFSLESYMPERLGKEFLPKKLPE